MSDTTAVEKVARAIASGNNLPWEMRLQIATAAIAAYEAHLAEAGMVSGPKNVLE